MADLFGFEIKRKKEKELPSVVAPSLDDGSTVTSSAVSAGGYYSMVMDLEGIVKNENDLIRRYREVAQYPDCDTAIDDIVNEAIVVEEDSEAVKIITDGLKQSTAIKNKIRVEFDEVYNLLKFQDKGHDLFRRWYIDGRLYFHILIDEKNPKNGIVELRSIDPRKIRKIKNVKKEKNAKGIEIVTGIEEYYIYNDKGITENTTQGVKMSLDSILYCPSGQIDANTGMMMSHLHKAIKPVNQLKMIEDAVVIYRISRAPERRIFYVDVGNLPKVKAEQYVNDLMNRYKNKIVYDANTGEVKDDRKHMSMLEDFWMPRREGGKGTEITTLPGGQNLGEIQDIQYFQTKLYQALNVPTSRLQSDTGFTLGRSTEISRDELKFTKYIARLRSRFSGLFLDALKVQLCAKGIIREDEWDMIRTELRFDYMKDNAFTELKETELLNNRLQALQLIEPYIGKYYSVDWVKKHVLRMSEDQIEEIQKEIDKEGDVQMIDAERQGTMQAVQQVATMKHMDDNGYGQDQEKDQPAPSKDKGSK
jgi:hypothetical protein